MHPILHPITGDTETHVSYNYLLCFSHGCASWRTMHICEVHFFVSHMLVCHGTNTHMWVKFFLILSHGCVLATNTDMWVTFFVFLTWLCVVAIPSTTKSANTSYNTSYITHPIWHILHNTSYKHILYNTSTTHPI